MLSAEAPGGEPALDLLGDRHDPAPFCSRSRVPGRSGHGPLDLLPRLGDLVPEADDRLVSALVFEGEHTHAGGSAVEEPPGPRRQAEPSSRDHPDDVPARKCQNVPLDAHDAGDDPIGSGGDIFGGLAFGAAVTKKLPGGPLPLDVPKHQPLVAAVIPLDQVGIDLRDRSKTGEFARPRGALKRAGEDGREGESPQSLTELAGAILADRVQGDVGPAGALARIGPGRVAVPGEEQSRQLGWHGLSSR